MLRLLCLVLSASVLSPSAAFLNPSAPQLLNLPLSRSAAQPLSLRAEHQRPSAAQPLNKVCQSAAKNAAVFGMAVGLALSSPGVSSAELPFGLSLPFLDDKAEVQESSSAKVESVDKNWRKKSLNQVFADFEKAEKEEASEMAGHEKKTMGKIFAELKAEEEKEEAAGKGEEHHHKKVGEYLKATMAEEAEGQAAEESHKKKTLSEIFATTEGESEGADPIFEVGEGDKNALTDFLTKAVVLIVIIPTAYIFPWYLIDEKDGTKIDIE